MNEYDWIPEKRWLKGKLKWLIENGAPQEKIWIDKRGDMNVKKGYQSFNHTFR